MVKRFLALYLLMALVMTGMSLVEWSHDPTGNIVDTSTDLVDTSVDAITAPPDGIYEITRYDFLDSDFTSEDISIMGVMLYDTLDEVTERLGTPDLFKTFPTTDGSEVVNLEYNFGAPAAALIVNLHNEEVQRLTVFSPFNQFLIGNSKMGFSKEETYKRFGIPENQEMISKYWMYTYEDRKFDILLENRENVGFSFFTEPLFVNEHRVD